MAYFTAVLARAGAGWKARDVDVEDSSTLDELADAMRAVAIDEGVVLTLVEHEDEWFALVRVDGEDDPRLFVSDLAAASGSSYGELLDPAGELDPENDIEDDDFEPASRPAAADDESADDADEDDGELSDGELSDDALTDGELTDDGEPAATTPPEPEAWAGEIDLLEDLGVSGKELCRLVEQHNDEPALVLGEISEAAGFGDLLENLR